MELLKRILPKEKIENLPEKESRIERIIRTLTRSTKSGVLVKGYDDVMIRFANCCTPLPGESIVGYITRGRGITIHNHGCSQLLDVDPARKIDVEWDKEFKGSRPVKIEVICADRPGVLSSITRSIASSDVNISKAEIHSTDDDRAIGTFEVAVSDLGQLEGVMKSIKKVKGVISVERVLGAEEV
jgi:guanosine-3',5'-bis(diphosphate) 3'-pyrophosphohydrolase